ncbi:MFS transporter [Labrys okinawensis]|uniref:MFS transporter n=1 Tax=Labrys okinawensis TaxID=346911 RepID=A0A2S9Q6T5_9HYPH|nr:MFS transporter [Labrys okinawensis]PRH85061.1 MFS transporter [Labrys okinawensis]
MDSTLASKRALPRSRRGLALLTLCLAVLIAQVDTAVVNLAVRPIGEAFSASIGALQWVVDGYNLVYAVMLLTGGLLADLRGRRLIFMAGAAIFTAASLLCAFSPTIEVLIAARALAGLGAALLTPSSLAILRVTWTDQAERERALGIWAACNGVAMAIGPTLGGILLHVFGWPSIFLVVVPIGLVALALAGLVIPESADPQGRHFDAGGQLVGAAALGGLAFAAIEMRERPSIALGASFLAVLSLVFFVTIEGRYHHRALVPLDIFQNATFRGAITATAGMTFGMYGTLFLLPLFWQEAGRLSPTMAGLALMPMAALFVAVSPFSGFLGRRLGMRTMTGGGVAVIGCGLLAIAASAHHVSILPAEIGLALTGLGMGMATGPLMGEAVGAVASARAGTASALINVARMVGATVGVAVLGSLYAVLGGGSAGLAAAMVVGGSVQIVAATITWCAAPAQR